MTICRHFKEKLTTYVQIHTLLSDFDHKNFPETHTHV